MKSLSVSGPAAPTASADYPRSGPLVDSYGRKIQNLRISITDRCNFRCSYCMPAEGLEWLPKSEILSFEELLRLSGIFVRLGIHELRLTGGEPTLRADLPDLIRMLSSHIGKGLESLSLTTNGVALKKLAKPLAEAGLTRINVSLDTLIAEKFHRITRRDCLQLVLEGLEEAAKYPSLRPIKVNAVAIKGFTDDEVVEFAKMARATGFIIRFIEYMPLDAEGNWKLENVLTGRELLQIINDQFMPLVPVENQDPTSTSRRYRFADGIGEIGFINPVSEPFCSTCNRIRLTADGALRTCLFSIDETSLRDPLRAGASDDEVEQIIRAAVWQKEKKHKINEGEAFKRASRSMSQIGG